MTSESAEPTEAKRALRIGARERRAVAHAAHGPSAGIAARDRTLGALDIARDAVVCGYWPFRDELDSAPLLEHFHGAGHEIGLPVVLARGRPMEFRPWRPGMRLAKGRLGEPVPPPDADYGAGDLVPALLFVPLLAFDRRGYRLGYGGGYFDLTIAQLRAAGDVAAVGLAYADQEVQSIPAEPHDQALDWIVTERAAIETGAGS